MSRVVTGKGWTLACADVLEALRVQPDCSFDALFCDPPYGLRFMGKAWDYDVPGVDVWSEALRVLKPGAPLLAFGGSRTSHRMTVAIEDAGFEIRDVLMYIYGKGFPKSQNIGLAIDKAAGATRQVVGTRTLTGNAAMSTKEKGGTYGVSVGSAGSVDVPVTAAATELAKQWDGYGTALKPAYEPIILARKRPEGTMAQNVAKWGVGGLAIDACRIEGPKRHPGNYVDSGAIWGQANGSDRGAFDALQGRWPANVLLDEDAADHLDEVVGDRKSGIAVQRNGGGGKGGRNITMRAMPGRGPQPDAGYADSGGPSRFFFTAKVSTREREFGCEDLPLRSAGEMTDRGEDEVALDSPRTGAGRGDGARNHHPTLKSIAANQWLARLVLPPTDAPRILIPFAGSGSEVIGALRAGWKDVFAIEREEDFVDIAVRRIRRWQEVPASVPVDEVGAAPAADERQATLFGKVGT